MNTGPLLGAHESEEPGWLARAAPAISIMAGSLITILPVITTFPILPPFGLLMLLGWRLLKAETVPVWMPLPLGLFDDLLSGQPMGSSMLLWTITVLAIDILDLRLVWRDFWQDWGLWVAGIAFCLIAGRLIATPVAAHVDTVLLLQILVSIMLYPLVARLCAWIERKRSTP